MRSGDSHMDFDLDLAVSQSNENPVYYAQYAHARICSILRSAETQGMKASTDLLDLLQSEKELDLLKKIGDFPQVVADAAKLRAPHRIATYIQELASTFHSFYNAEKVLDAERVDLSRSASCVSNICTPNNCECPTFNRRSCSRKNVIT